MPKLSIYLSVDNGPLKEYRIHLQPPGWIRVFYTTFIRRESMSRSSVRISYPRTSREPVGVGLTVNFRDLSSDSRDSVRGIKVRLACGCEARKWSPTSWYTVLKAEGCNISYHRVGATFVYEREGPTATYIGPPCSGTANGRVTMSLEEAENVRRVHGREGAVDPQYVGTPDEGYLWPQP